METNFFKSIASLNLQGGWNITISNETPERLIVSLLFFNDGIGDDARKKVPPILLKGTPQELDEGFFNAVAQPVKETAALFINMESYLKEREEAKKASAMEKDKTAKADKEKTDKLTKYEAAMKLVDELEAQGKPKEAWMKVPSPQEYPQHAETLRARKSSLSAQFEQDLFNTPNIR